MSLRNGAWTIAWIYEIRNVKNNIVYIGSTNDFIRRKKEHIAALNENKHYNDYLQNAWNKYGADSFKFKAIAKIDDSVQYEKEQEYIDAALKNEIDLYNICTDVKNPNRREPMNMICTYSEDKGKTVCGKAFVTVYWNQRYCPVCSAKSKQAWEKKKRDEEWEYDNLYPKFACITYVKWDVVSE